MRSGDYNELKCSGIHPCFFGLFWVIQIPAIIIIGMWAVMQFMNGMVSAAVEQPGGGVAWFAHISGFLFGMLTIRFWLPARLRR